MSIPDLELEANAPEANDARSEEKAMPGTPALYEDLITRRKSTEEVNSASAISKIKHLRQNEKESLQDNRTARLWL